MSLPPGANGPYEQVEPPPFNTLVEKAVSLGYQLPDVEVCEMAQNGRRTFDVVRVTITGSPLFKDTVGVCRILPGPRDSRMRLAARSALAHALDVAQTPDGSRLGIEPTL